MQMDTGAVMKENNGQEIVPPRRPKFNRLSSSCETPRATNTKRFTFDDVGSAPSLEASLDCSSASSAAEDRYVSTSTQLTNSSKMPQTQPTAVMPQTPTNDSCITDRVVRFFCPFDVAQEPLSPGATTPTRKQRSTNSHSVQNSPYATSTAMCTPHQDCSGDWLKTANAMICIPEQWEQSPDRTALAGRRLDIKNRCSASDAKERKAEYIQQIRKEWHSRSAAVPLKSSRSEAVAKYPPSRPPMSIQVPSSNNPAVFYDSDPEVAPSTPRFKRNRPTSLNLDLISNREADTSEFECPRVPRHSIQELTSFFDSPRSVTKMPDFNDDAAVRQFIQLATEERVSFVWHQAPTANDGGHTTCQAPKSITGYFEPGSQLDNIVVFPKFVWRQAFQSGTNFISRTPHFIQLLAIVGVIAPSYLDRRLYPFARLDRTCCIQTHDGNEYVFEASCGQERDLFVTRLKVLVSRLASSVIVHDETMLKEFFSPTGNEAFADDLSVDCQSIEDSTCKPPPLASTNEQHPQCMSISVDL